MIETELRTVRLERADNTNGHVQASEPEGDVLIAAVGALRRASAGRSIRETLHDAGIPLPTATQTLRVNADDVADLERVVQPHDKVTIVNRVAGG